MARAIVLSMEDWWKAVAAPPVIKNYCYKLQGSWGRLQEERTPRGFRQITGTVLSKYGIVEVFGINRRITLQLTHRGYHYLRSIDGREYPIRWISRLAGQFAKEIVNGK